MYRKEKINFAFFMNVRSFVNTKKTYFDYSFSCVKSLINFLMLLITLFVCFYYIQRAENVIQTNNTISKFVINKSTSYFTFGQTQLNF